MRLRPAKTKLQGQHAENFKDTWEGIADPNVDPTYLNP